MPSLLDVLFLAFRIISTILTYFLERGDILNTFFEKIFKGGGLWQNGLFGDYGARFVAVDVKHGSYRLFYDTVVR